MKKASILLLFPLLLTLMGITYNTKNVAIYDDWGSIVMELGQDKVYRASVKNGNSRLIIDREPPDCNSYKLTVQREADKYFANNFYITAFAQLRVDTNPIHEAAASVSETKGENTTFISIKIEESYRLYSELQNGNSIRIKLNVDGEEQIYEFSLNGSEAALQRAQRLCGSNDTGYSEPPLLESSSQKPSWCNNKLNQTEQVICNNSSLWAVENRIVEVFKQLRNESSTSEEKRLIKEQGQWLKQQRNIQCLQSVSACLQVYQERIADLESRLGSSKPFLSDSSSQQPSWCNNKLNQTEQVICNNSSLWAVENRIVEVFKQLRNESSTSEEKRLIKEQGQWLKQQRNIQCLQSVNACLRVYQERIADLESRLN